MLLQNRPVSDGLLLTELVGRLFGRSIEAGVLAVCVPIEGPLATPQHLVFALELIGLSGRIVNDTSRNQISTVSSPSIIQLRDGSYRLFRRLADGRYILRDPRRAFAGIISLEKIASMWSGTAVQVSRAESPVIPSVASTIFQSPERRAHWFLRSFQSCSKTDIRAALDHAEIPLNDGTLSRKSEDAIIEERSGLSPDDLSSLAKPALLWQRDGTLLILVKRVEQIAVVWGLTEEPPRYVPFSQLIENWSGKASFIRSLASVDGLPTTSDAGASRQALDCVALAAGLSGVNVDVETLRHGLALADHPITHTDIVRAATHVGLKARLVHDQRVEVVEAIGELAILPMRDGTFRVLRVIPGQGIFLRDPRESLPTRVTLADLDGLWSHTIILVGRRSQEEDEPAFGFRWFILAMGRYRGALSHVLLTSLFCQVFALSTPVFFQVVVDKVLVHKSMSTLSVITIGLVGIAIFDVMLQGLRSYVLYHTTSRIDVELGARLFRRLLELPLSYFETRAAGQTVARVRELDTVRAFLTGQALTSVLDLLFVAVFVAVLFTYSRRLAILVIASIPLYIVVAIILRPAIREKIAEKFRRGAATQQLLIEAVIGAQTVKAAAVEPLWLEQWETKLAAYVGTSFSAVMLGTIGQGSIQLIGKLTSALTLYFGAIAVIDGEMTVGALVAFNMLAGQLYAPIQRLANLWQDFQQVQISVNRIGDILDSSPEEDPQQNRSASLPPIRGHIELKDVEFRYSADAPAVLKQISLKIAPCEVVGIVGPSGSGKSTITKLIQRLYLPQEGSITVDGMDIRHVPVAWLRRQIGVVLQENMLFNRTIHENIALAAPSMSRRAVIEVARLAGAHEFVSKLPLGYDTPIEERGSNLSGGQRQRIAIARALATNPRILILDEATSALDYESERIVRDSMAEISQTRTVIVIAHRLAAVKECSRIISVVAGRIVEEGTHADLVSQPTSVYARLWALQSR